MTVCCIASCSAYLYIASCVVAHHAHTSYLLAHLAVIIEGCWCFADLRNVCTEAGMFAIRDERDYVVQEDFMKAVRKMNDAKKLETTISYDSSFGDGGKS